MPAENRTVEQYVAELPKERRAAIEAVREVIRKHLPRGYEEQLRDALTRAGRKLDMGRSCVRFRTPEDLELDAIADAIAAIPPDEFITLHEAAHKKRP